MKLLSKQILILSFVLVILCAPLAALASDNGAENVFITKDTTIDSNFVQIGDMINISGTMKKDVIVFAQSVVVDGVIEGDLIGVANSLTINGEVKGNVRFVASEIKVNGSVDKNLTVAASDLSINAPIGWGVASYGSSIDITHEQKCDVVLYGQMVNIGRSIDGKLDINVPGNGQIKFATGVAVAGNLSYSDIRDIANLDSVKVGGVKHLSAPFEIMPWKKQHDLGYIYGQLIYFFSLFLLGLIMLFAFRPIVRRISASLSGGVIESFKWGVMYFVLVPIAVLLVALTIIGLPIAAIVLIFYIVAIYIAKVFVSLVIGSWLLSAKGGSAAGGKNGLKQGNLILPLLLGTFVVVIMISAPYVGPVLNLIITIVGLGALIEVSREIIKEISASGGK